MQFQGLSDYLLKKYPDQQITCYQVVKYQQQIDRKNRPLKNVEKEEFETKIKNIIDKVIPKKKPKKT